MGKGAALVAELRERGLIEQVSNDEALAAAFDDGPVTLYCGFDPTATSLHLGNLIPVMLLAHVQRAGHRPIVLVGGATGMIGDPSGRDSERKLLSPSDVKRNCEAIAAQLASYVSFEGENGALMVDNSDWINPITFVEWLRDVGKYFTINYMIAKESVRSRLENREQGITFTEFSYMMLQAYDFTWLYEHHGCTLQVGGNDQWGNITAGIDLTHKKLGAQVFGLTAPLLTTASGDKFGKSVGNAVWLEPELTSPYEFYQYWIQTDDRDVARWLRVFTFLPLEEIDAIASAHGADPGRREGQKRLAAEVTRRVHGEAGLAAALKATEVLFGAEIGGMTDRELGAIFRDVPSSDGDRGGLREGLTVLDLFAGTLCKSKGEARRLVKQGGAYVNNRRVDDIEARYGESDLATETSLVLRAGKKKYWIVRFG